MLIKDYEDKGYLWECVTMDAGFIGRDGAALVSFNSNLYMLGGWNSQRRDLYGAAAIRDVPAEQRTIKMPGGIFLSEDGGDTWKQILDEGQYIYDVTVDPYHKGRVYACSFHRFAYRSDDYGKTWKKLKGYDFNWGHRVIVDENNPEKVFITTFGGSVFHGYPVTE